MKELTTREGVFEAATALMAMMSTSFRRSGMLRPGVAFIATVANGERLATPGISISLSVEPLPTYFEVQYQKAIRKHHAVGVMSFFESWSAPYDRPADANAWLNRDLSEHPEAYETLTCVLEHKTFGTHTWKARIRRAGDKVDHTPFELMADRGELRGGFLETLRALS